MGRKEANASFLNELLRQDPFGGYHFFIRNLAHKEHLESVLKTRFTALWETGRAGVRPIPDLPLSVTRHEYACFHLSDWSADFVNLAIVRNAFSRELFPITAPVHTLSYAALVPHLLRLFWDGASPRERIITTSAATERVLEQYFAQFRQGYGLKEGLRPPALERIPLGVDLQAFASPEEKALAGKNMRERLRIGDAVLFLSFSRVTPLSKMDLMPVFDAFERAREMGLDFSTCCLIVAGHMPDQALGEILTARARNLGLPFFLFSLPETPDPKVRRELYAAADVFLSPVDNIQETFGLTILEAFASSLPVIASDIDGYTELVSHEKDGLLLPTLGPASADASTALSSLFLPDLYHLFFAQQCVVELGAFAGALLRLGTDKNARAAMGEAGRTKALGYAWGAVVRRYLALWERLASLEIGPEEEAALRRARHPLIPDYTRVFGSYFSALDSDFSVRSREVRLSGKGRKVLRGDDKLAVYSLLRPFWDSGAVMELLRAAENPQPFGLLSDSLAAGAGARARDRNAALLWALKHGYLEFVG